VGIEGERTDSAFARFERDIAELMDSGRRVYLVLSNPVSGAFDPASMLPERLPGLGNRKMVRAVQLTDSTGDVSRTMSRLRAIAARTGATIIDPVAYLCKGSTCPTVDERGRPIYVDSHHMRAAFTRERITYLDQALGPE
jgi:hypothetical protein